MHSAVQKDFVYQTENNDAKLIGSELNYADNRPQHTQHRIYQAKKREV